MAVGILALQGAFAEHGAMLDKIGAEHFEIRQKKDATVLFLDSDDLLKEDAIWQAAQFFEKEPEVNIASLKILYFDAKEGKADTD